MYTLQEAIKYFTYTHLDRFYFAYNDNFVWEKSFSDSKCKQFVDLKYYKPNYFKTLDVAIFLTEKENVAYFQCIAVFSCVTECCGELTSDTPIKFSGRSLRKHLSKLIYKQSKTK